MFKKLVSNLPYNPSLVTEFRFYTDRLKKEKAIRGVSFFLIIIAMFVQMFAVVSPPEKSLAASSNHILDGLSESKSAKANKSFLLQSWDNNQDIRDIYGYFGVTRDDIVAMPEKTETVFSGNSDYWSIGRNSLNAYSNVEQKYKDTQVAIRYAGEDTATTSDDKYVYHRQLKAWDIVNKSGNSYGALKGTIKSSGETFWILYDCGNFTKIGKYVPPKEPDPLLEIKKTIINKPASLKPGDSYTYLIQYRNTVNGSLAENVSITDELDTRHFDVTSTVPANIPITNGFLKYDIGGLAFSTNYQDLRINVKLKDQISSGSEVCNASQMTSTNSAATESPTVCIGVITPCPFDSTIPDINNPNCTEPKIVCSLVDSAVNRTTRKVTFRTIVTSSNPTTTQVFGYNYEFGDGTPVLTQQSSGFTNEASHTYKAGKYTAKVIVTYGATGIIGKQEVSCSSPISFDDDKAVGQSKSVRNITQDKTGKIAETTTVNSNDVLEYTLTTSNVQNYERVDIEVSDYIGDILDYAALDTAYLKEKGGTFNETTKKVVWKDVKIPATGEVKHSFKVKVKDPVPTTNSPSTVSTTFDCKLSNEYGNQVTINVNCPLVKGVESLPNTGPGSSMIIITFVTTVIGYFFARNKLLVKELNFIKNDYASSGGM